MAATSVEQLLLRTWAVGCQGRLVLRFCGVVLYSGLEAEAPAHLRQLAADLHWNALGQHDGRLAEMV